MMAERVGVRRDRVFRKDDAVHGGGRGTYLDVISRRGRACA